MQARYWRVLWGYLRSGLNPELGGAVEIFWVAGAVFGVKQILLELWSPHQLRYKYTNLFILTKSKVFFSLWNGQSGYLMCAGCQNTEMVWHESCPVKGDKISTHYVPVMD